MASGPIDRTAFSCLPAAMMRRWADTSIRACDRCPAASSACIEASAALHAFRASVSMEVRARSQARFKLPAHVDAPASQCTRRSVGGIAGYWRPGA
ncbi:hypothetical protein XAPC_3991 [Xanthomonas citri pv. punicae str. LMG 859]|nr:hypothetical protein XAPC_3991 [Xanthomonas citri pv. punicae str. LMG 859]